MKQILLAYDGSPASESALGDLPRMGLDAGASICILNVVGGSATPDELAKAEKKTQHASRVAAGLLPQAQVQTMIVAGHAAEEILREAVEQQTDLIIIGAHGKSALERLFFGSISTKITTEGPCSVRICRTHGEPGFQHLRLTLAVDGSPGAELAIANVLQRPWPHGTGFHVITVAADQSAAADSAGSHLVAQVTAQLKAAGFFAAPVVLEGDPAKALLKESETWAPHCILIGSRNAGQGGTGKIGTLANELVRHGNCQVEVIR